jgi:hypothetical protein
MLVANRWKTFTGRVKRDNLRRPAFQEEFAKVSRVAGVGLNM